MEDYLRNILGIFAFIYLTGTFYFAFSLILRSKDDFNYKNFSVADTPKLLNKEFKCEFFYPFIEAFITTPLKLMILSALFILIEQYAVLNRHIFNDILSSMPLFFQVIIGLLILDISLYIRHWFVHKYFWNYHAVHHSAQEITWLTAHRLHPVDAIVMGIIDYSILYILGFDALGMAIAVIIKNYYNHFVHSNIRLDYGKPFKYIFVSPNMHRWHHDAGKEGYNKNFCIIFAFIDLAMGTYYVPDNRLPKRYGSNNKMLDDIELKGIIRELIIPFQLSKNLFLKKLLNIFNYLPFKKGIK